jgi:ATP-dependent helicase/nuclease subunit B
MYDWLGDALHNEATVVTANRRLARVLRQQFNQQQVAAGHIAWAAPAIASWKDWLTRALRSTDTQASLPTLINQHQSQLLWERCLAKELPDAGQSIHGLVRLSQEAWQRLADWQVSIQEVARSAQSDDQRLFARVAGRYMAILEHENWVDDAGLGAILLETIVAGHVAVSGTYTFAGFDRPRPIESALHDAISAMGGRVQMASTPAAPPSIVLQSFETADAEMRAAGAWARARLEQDGEQSIAIIGSNLAQQADGKARLVREGLVPGWQYAQGKLHGAENV